MPLRLARGDRFDRIGEHLTIAHAARIVRELGTRAPLGVADHLTQSIEQAIVCRAERDVAVGAADRLIRRVHPVRGAERGRYAAARKIFGCLPHRQRDARVDERRVDLLSGAGALPMMQRREDARDREQARAEIRERHAGFPRRTARARADHCRRRLGKNAHPDLSCSLLARKRDRSAQHSASHIHE